VEPTGGPSRIHWSRRIRRSSCAGACEALHLDELATFAANLHPSAAEHITAAVSDALSGTASHPMTHLGRVMPLPPVVPPSRAGTGTARSWLGLGLELVEGVGGLSESVGDGLVPVYVRTAGAEFARALLAQSFRHDQADRGENR
jgi:hypothetical protein